jgi:hypothetical protein
MLVALTAFALLMILARLACGAVGPFLRGNLIEPFALLEYDRRILSLPVPRLDRVWFW